MSKENRATVRIKQITINDFKSVNHGLVTLNSGQSFVSMGTEPDILGLYGQNGSGKTALVDALHIINYAISGKSVPASFCDCINVVSGEAQIEVTFDMQWNDGTAVEAMYYFSLLNSHNLKELDELPESGFYSEKGENKVSLKDEVLSYRSIYPEKNNKKIIYAPLLMEEDPFKYDISKKNLFTERKWHKSIFDIEIDKRAAAMESRSAIFSPKLLECCDKRDDIGASIIEDLMYFGKYNFTVIDTKAYGKVQSNEQIPLFISNNYVVPINSDGFNIPQGNVSEFLGKIKELSKVVETIIPGMEISVKDLGAAVDENGNTLTRLLLMSSRDMYSEGHIKVRMPIRYESDGVKRMISFLFALISAFNNKSYTLVIDEIDSGLFEYLLGELLQAFEESGRGQLIFTSHNLRPLEVIDRNHIYFTTTDPDDRYMQMKGIRDSNNLRNVYFREILTNSTQDKEVYSYTNRCMIVEAIRMAGEIE